MSLLIVSLATALCLLFAQWTGGMGERAGLRARAQAAADAAALAAVAEAAPHGDGVPGVVARRYAEANGAELLSCECPAGAFVVTVTTSVGGVRARARAQLDPERFAPARVAYDAGGLHPALASAVDELLAAGRGAFRVASGYRSSDHQAELWSAALRRYGSAEVADDWVAPPGHSMHERGLAVDLAGDVEFAARLVEALGLPLHRPLPHEPWHFELVGSR